MLINRDTIRTTRRHLNDGQRAQYRVDQDAGTAVHRDHVESVLYTANDVAAMVDGLTIRDLYHMIEQLNPSTASTLASALRDVVPA